MRHSSRAFHAIDDGSLDFRELLEQLRREELQEVCGALALDAGGREKAKLVDRILGVKEVTAPAAAGSEPPPSILPPSMLGGGHDAR